MTSAMTSINQAMDLVCPRIDQAMKEVEAVSGTTLSDQKRAVADNILDDLLKQFGLHRYQTPDIAQANVGISQVAASISFGGDEEIIHLPVLQNAKPLAKGDVIMVHDQLIVSMQTMTKSTRHKRSGQDQGKGTAPKQPKKAKQ